MIDLWLRYFYLIINGLVRFGHFLVCILCDLFLDDISVILAHAVTSLFIFPTSDVTKPRRSGRTYKWHMDADDSSDGFLLLESEEDEKKNAAARPQPVKTVISERSKKFMKLRPLSSPESDFMVLESDEEMEQSGKMTRKLSVSKTTSSLNPGKFL